MAEGGIWNCIRGGNLDELAKRVERSIKTKIDESFQLDWSKIDRSKFCASYKDRKDNIEMITRWKKEELEGVTKETWARLRCGSVGKERTKGYKDFKCSQCAGKKTEVPNVRRTFANLRRWRKKWVTRSQRS